MKITANDITHLLKQRYPLEKFLTVPECKIGSTWFKSNCQRFDMWAMARSWAYPRFIGFEIKVSRSDFLNDNKWPGYLPYCSEFYFVAPPGVIDPSEVPEQAGLILTTKNFKRLITKKKAPVRDIEIPQSILVYILMCRTRVTADTGSSTADYWQQKLKEMKADKKLGWEVSSEIQRRVASKVQDVMEKNRRLVLENRRLVSDNDGFDQVRAMMAALGLDCKHLKTRQGQGIVSQRLQEALTGIPYDLPRYLRDISEKAGLAAEALENRTPVEVAA